MCGRYYVDEKIEQEILSAVHHVSSKINRKRAGDVHPSEYGLVITGREHGLTAESMKWGFSMDSSQLIINARAETVLDKKTFSDSVKARRCVIPARHFYEWDREKNKVTFSRVKSEPLYMAGFYNMMKNEDCFVILTTAANASMSPVHDRMPLILSEEQVDTWIRDERETGKILAQVSPMLERTQEYEQLSLFY